MRGKVWHGSSRKTAQFRTAHWACHSRRRGYPPHMTPTDLSVDTPMAAIIGALPGARRALFARYHLGGCQSCAFSNEETLAQLCRRAGGLPPDEVLAHLLEGHAHDQHMLMEPADARDRLAAGPPPRLIDIRTREEHEAVAIPGSEFSTQELQQQLFAGEPDAEILLYDHTGANVLDQVAWYRGHGLGRTFGLRGGIDAWSREIDPKLPRYRMELD
jgi:rhodanese-related sulfurtransferase